MKGRTLQPHQKPRRFGDRCYLGLSGVGQSAKWLRGLDLNQRPLGYEPNELPGCSTPQLQFTLCRQSGQMKWGKRIGEKPHLAVPGTVCFEAGARNRQFCEEDAPSPQGHSKSP